MSKCEQEAEAIGEVAAFFVAAVTDDRLPLDVRREIYRLTQLPAFDAITGTDVYNALEEATRKEE